MDNIPKKILVIQFRQIGDVLLCSPAARVLKDNFPQAKLDLLVQPPSDQALARNPAIDELLVYDPGRPLHWALAVRRRGYDLIVDFMSNPRSAVITALSGARVKAGPAYTCSSWAYNLKLELRPGQIEYNPFFKIDLLRQLGLKNIFYPAPEFFPAPGDLEWAAGVTAGLKRPLILIAPASRRETRRWPAEHYARLAALAAEKRNASVLVLWGPGERPLAEEVARLAAHPSVGVSPETATLSRLSALLKQAVLLVSNCSGTKHLAQASGVPTLGIYGSSRPESWTLPDDARHRVVRSGGMACIACQKSECSLGIRCLKELQPDTVFATLEEMLVPRKSR
jgi:ADP-heptose:LPS heptosyltransferase